MRAFNSLYCSVQKTTFHAISYFTTFQMHLSPLFVCVIMLPPFCIHILDALLHFGLRINMKGS